ncbi:MAG: transposase [Cyanobacteria bacterium J06638_28]
MMKHSQMGQIVRDVWRLIPQQFDHCRLDAFVVMPDHIHGILVLVDHVIPDGMGRDAINRVSTHTPIALNPLPIGGITGHHNPMLGKSLSRIVRWYKGRCTHTMRQIRPDFTWQSRFHDHIIRNEKVLTKIRHYIHNNAIHHS